MNIFRKECSVILRLLSRSWANVEEFDVILENLETNPQFVQIAPSNEMAILVTLSVTTRDIQGFVNLCYPSSTLEPLNDKLSTRMWAEPINTLKNQRIFKKNFTAFKTENVHILGRTTVSLQDILDLEVGDVVRLDSFHDEPIELEIEGTKVFKAQIGKIKGFHGVKVVKKDEELLEKTS